MKRTLPRTDSGTQVRPYSQTHPWITFSLDLTKAPFPSWMDLGAVQSKIEHVANVLLPPKIAKDLHTLYLAKGIHGTTAIEGNTLSEEQVRQRIRGERKLPESKAYLGKEIDNIVEACNEIAAAVLEGGESPLTTDQIIRFNEVVLQGLPLEEHVAPGQFRTYSVGVAGYRGAPSEDCGYLVDRLCHWLNTGFEPPSDDLATGFAVLKAIMAHLYLAWIHPFGDGNGRTARLVEFRILLSGGVPSVAAHLLSNFYNQTRAEYYRQLAAASRSGGDVMPFISYALRGLRDSLDEQIQGIRSHQWRVAWRDHVFWKFRDGKGEAVDRRRLVALELAKVDPPAVRVDEIKELTPGIAARYARKTAKTLTRDLNELQAMELIVRQGRTVRANRDLLIHFLPRRRTPPQGEQASQGDQRSHKGVARE